MIPLVHDFAGEPVLVFGGGRVGARRARYFEDEADDVVVVSPAFGDHSFGEATLVRAEPGPADVSRWLDRTDPTLVVAATDDGDLNRAVADASRERGLLLNRVDRTDRADRAVSSGRADRADGRAAGSVTVPATVEDGPVTVSISTDGISPVLSRHLRRELESVVDGSGAMATLSGDLRTELAARDLSAADRRRALRAVVDSERVWKALDTPDANPRDEAAAVIAATLDGRQAGESP